MRTNKAKEAVRMTLRKLNIALGPKQTLADIRAAHPDRNLIMLREADDHAKYALVDQSGKDSVFATDLHFQVLRTLNFQDWQGYIEFRYLTLDNDERKVFDSLVTTWDDSDKRPVGLQATAVLEQDDHNYQYLMINEWESEEAYVTWANASDNPLARFGYSGNKQAVVNRYERVK